MRNFGIIAAVVIFLSEGVNSGKFFRNAASVEAEGLESRFDGDFRYAKCDDMRPPCQLVQLEINPKQFKMLQNVTISIAFNITEDVAAPLTAEIEMFKKVPLMGYVKLPCILNYGSCTYRNVCEVIDKAPRDSFEYKAACPEWLEASGLKCKCPFKQGAYGVKEFGIPIGDINVPKWIVAGDYKITLIINDTTQTVVCNKFQFRLK